MTANTLAQEALDLSLAQGYAKGEADSLRVLARARLYQKALPDALTQALRSHELYTQLEDVEGLAYLHYLLGQIYWRMGRLDTGLHYALIGLEPAEQSGNFQHLMALYGILGAIYFDLGKHDQAIQYIHQVLTLSEAKDLHNFVPESLNNLAYVLYTTGRYQEGITYVEQSLRLHMEQGAGLGILPCLHTAGVLYLAVDDYETARSYLEQGLQSAQANQIYPSISEFSMELGRLAQKQGEMAQAVEWMSQALDFAEKFQAPLRQAQIHQALAEVYAQQGDFEQALGHHQRFHDFDKLVFNEKSDQRLQALQVEHELEIARKEAEIYRVETETLGAEIERRRAIEAELQETVRRDFLVDAYNRRYFFEEAEEALAQTQSQSLAFFLIDLDHFKEINDTFGHLAADRVLQAAVEQIKSLLGPGDILARYGGDEFVLMCVDTSPQACQALGHAMGQHLAAYPFLPGAPVTASIGASLYQPGDAPISLELLLDRADQALYAVKRRGRNGFQIWAAGASL
jgi:diguanylate cyclase (GGDEF)-like protein